MWWYTCAIKGKALSKNTFNFFSNCFNFGIFLYKTQGVTHTRSNNKQIHDYISLIHGLDYDLLCGDIPYKEIAPSTKTFSLVLAVESKFAARISRVNYAKLVSFNFGT